MNILSVYLQRALPEEQPLVATMLLQLDFMVFQIFYSMKGWLNGLYLTVEIATQFLYCLLKL